MNRTHLIPRIALILASGVSASSVMAAPSLCEAKSEQTAFSCTFRNGKVASICMAKATATEPASLQYRFGAAGKAPELSFPANPVDGPKTMAFGFNGGAKGGFRNVRFETRSYSYLVTAYSGVYDEPEAYITVRREGVSCRVLACQRGHEDNMDQLLSFALREIPLQELQRDCRTDGS